MVIGNLKLATELRRFVSVKKLMLQENGLTSKQKDLTTKCTRTGAEQKFTPSSTWTTQVNIAQRIMVSQALETCGTKILTLKVTSLQCISNRTTKSNTVLSRSSKMTTARNKMPPSLPTKIQTTLKSTLAKTCRKEICLPMRSIV